MHCNGRLRVVNIVKAKVFLQEIPAFEFWIKQYQRLSTNINPDDQSSGWKLMEWMEINMYYYGEDPAIAFYFLQVSIAVCVNSNSFKM